MPRTTSGFFAPESHTFEPVLTDSLGSSLYETSFARFHYARGEVREMTYLENDLPYFLSIVELLKCRHPG